MQVLFVKGVRLFFLVVNIWRIVVSVVGWNVIYFVVGKHSLGAESLILWQKVVASRL